MTMRIILALSLLLSACAYCGDQPLITITGGTSSGGGQFDPSATNAVLEASMFYTDTVATDVFYNAAVYAGTMAGNAERNAKSYSDSNLNTAKSYSDGNLNSAKAYSDANFLASKSYSDTNLNLAKSYSDSRLQSTASEIVTYMTATARDISRNDKADALLSAKLYSDTNTLVRAKSYASSIAASDANLARDAAIAASKSYSDTNTLVSAKAYADSDLNLAKGYSDNNLNSAKAYADGVLNLAEGYSDNNLNTAKAYSDANLLTAKGYSDNNFIAAKTYSDTNTLFRSKAYTDDKVSSLTWGSDAKLVDSIGFMTPILLSDTFVTPCRDESGFGLDFDVNFGDSESYFFIFSGAAYEYGFTNSFGQVSSAGGSPSTNVVVFASNLHLVIQRVTPVTPTSFRYFLIEFKVLRFPRNGSNNYYPSPPSGIKTFYFIAKVD